MHVILIIAQLVLHIVIEFAWSLTDNNEDLLRTMPMNVMKCLHM